jgi:hypothetical protein
MGADLKPAGDASATAAKDKKSARESPRPLHVP